MKLLVVEDDERTAALLARGLREAAHQVDVVGSGEEACGRITAEPYGAVVLDVMLPGIDGIETCRRLREMAVPAPILMLSARGEVADRVEGLDAGADDYVAKPFFIAEVLARLRAFERRPGHCTDGALRAGALWYDPATLGAGYGPAEVGLTLRQGAVLEVLMDHVGQVLTRATIADAAWGGTLDLHSNVVDVHVGALRRKLAGIGVDAIETVRGLGYRLTPVDP